jgi:hypothetical protein
METAMQFTIFIVTSVAGLIVALALQSALLQATLRLMQPATANRRPKLIPIEQGTRLVGRVCTGGR